MTVGNSDIKTQIVLEIKHVHSVVFPLRLYQTSQLQSGIIKEVQFISKIIGNRSKFILTSTSVVVHVHSKSIHDVLESFW